MISTVKIHSGVTRIFIILLFVQYDQRQLSTSCIKLVLEHPVIRQNRQ